MRKRAWTAARLRGAFPGWLLALAACRCVPASLADVRGTEYAVALGNGIAAYDAGRFAQAVDEFRALSRLHPDAPEALYYLGVSLAGAGDNAGGAAALEALLASHPGFPGAERELCIALLGAGRREEAGRCIDAVRGRAATPAARAELLFLEALRAGGDGRYVEAADLLSRAEREAPGVDPRAQRYRETYLRLAQQADAGVRIPGRDSPPKRWSSRITTRYEYDDNVALLPDSGGPADVSNAGDWRFMTTFELDAVPLEKDRFELDTRYFFVQSVHNRMGDYNLNGHLADAIVRYRHPLLTPFVGYEYGYYFLDDCHQSYLRANRLTGGVEFPWRAHSLYRLWYECAFDDYMVPYDTPADNWDTMPANKAGGEHYLFFGPGKLAYWRTGAMFINNNAEGANFYSNGVQISGRLSLPLPMGFSASPGMDYYYSRYPRNEDGRTDNRIELDAELRKRITENFDFVLNYNLTRNSSTLTPYQFSRNIYSMVLEASF